MLVPSSTLTLLSICVLTATLSLTTAKSRYEYGPSRRVLGPANQGIMVGRCSFILPRACLSSLALLELDRP